MLHRAARNAYSWWWANHVRTKQLKWLEQNVHDMEEKLEYILSVINEDGDSFMMKADMFFRKRPELVNFIEDCLQGYRALARRYDKLSKVMQNANRTIATAFPEQMQLDMDDDFDDLPPVTSSFHEPQRPPKSLPSPPVISPKKSPSFSRKSFKSPTRMMSKRGLLKLGSMNDAAIAATKKSGLSKSEALVEIDRLQKGILALQTEKEFVKSSYENGLAKCLDIENEVTSMQAKVNSLEDEFGIEKAIEDDEARMLMAATALNSCQEKIMSLQDKQEKTTEEAKGESQKLDKIRDKFDMMIEQLSKENSEKESVRETKKLQASDQNISIEEEIGNLGLVNVSLQEQLQVNGDSTLTVTILAEKIDELVDTVLNLESAVSSQGALVERLRSESNKLQEKLQSLEVDKETLTDSSEHKNKKIRDLENELQILQSFKQSIINQDKNSQNMLDGSSSIDNSADKVQNVESREPPREVSGVNYMLSPKRNHIGDPRAKREVQKGENHDSKVLSAEVQKNEKNDNEFLEPEPKLQTEQGNIHVDDYSMQELKVEGNENNKDSQNMLEGSSSIDNSVVKVQNVESHETPREVTGVNYMPSSNRKHIGDPRADEEVQKDEKHDSKVLTVEPNLQSKQGSNLVDGHSMQELKMKGNEKNKNSQNMLKDGGSSIDNSGDKVENVVSHEPPREVSGVNYMLSPNSNYIVNPRVDQEVQNDKNHASQVLTAELELQSEQQNNHVDDHSMQELKMKCNEKKHERLSMIDDGDVHEYGIDEEHRPNWRQIFLNDLEDREKLLLEEYTSLLRNFKQVKKKLNDSEKKHRANLFKSTLQLKVLKSANASKDAEIQSLHTKLNLIESEHDVPSTNESTKVDSRQVLDTSSPDLEQRETYDISEGQVESIGSTGESTVAAQTNDSKKYDGGDLELESAISSIEEKIRMDLDELLEENIEFWLKYSTSFHQVQKFQTIFEDLLAEITELNESKNQEGSTLQHSDVRPIYMHLREIQTELTLWLEQNVVLEDDLQNRISSISSIQEEITRSSNVDSVFADETELTDHQAAKFTGEVMNMKQQNNKVANELLDGIEHVKKLKVEIENVVAKLDQEFGFSAAKQTKQSRSRIPLRSFLFGAKLKKQKGSLLARIAPRQQPHQSDVCEVQPPSK